MPKVTYLNMTSGAVSIFHHQTMEKCALWTGLVGEIKWWAKIISSLDFSEAKLARYCIWIVLVDQFHARFGANNVPNDIEHAFASVVTSLSSCEGELLMSHQPCDSTNDDKCSTIVYLILLEFEKSKI